MNHKLKDLMRGSRGPARAITALQESGHKVYVSHFRRWHDENGETVWATIGDAKRNPAFALGAELLPTGGETTVKVVREIDDEVIATGSAVCCTKDNFSRNLGVRIALGRALHETDVPEPAPSVL